MGSIDAYLKESLEYDGKHLYWKTLSGRRKPGPVGSINSKGYAIVSLTFEGKRNSYLVHRVCWFLHYRGWPTRFLDHINGNRLDNRIENLREVTLSQNSRNKFGNFNSKVPWKGVTYHKRDKTYDAVVGVRGKNTYLGRFMCSREAALSYNYVAFEMFGDYAKCNPVFEDVSEEVLNGEA